MDNILTAIGNTPLIRLHNIEKAYNLSFHLSAKLERSNPSGSIKDRAAKYIIENAIKNKEIDDNSIIVEATSGNMGISLASICAIYNLKCVIFMPKSASIERRKMMKILGAEVILVDGGMKECNAEVKKYREIHPNSYEIKQFDNIYNTLAHYETTSLEIINQLHKLPDVFISAFGTSGTLIGCAKRFKEKGNTHIIGVEPYESPLLSENRANFHKIQGIGANFIPSLYNKEYVDEIRTVKGDEAYKMVKVIAKTEGILVGISSGAAIACAIGLDKDKYKNQDIVVILPDNLERYLTVEELYE